MGKEKIFKNEIKISGYRDMRYVNDVPKKLSAVLDLPIEYFIITNYKAKQEANITDYSDLDYRVVIYEEED